MFGEGFISQHILQYVKQFSEKRSYQIYVTSCLQAIAENTTHYLTGKGIEDYGKSMNKSWADIIDPPKPTKEEKELENIDCVEFTKNMFKKIRGKGDNK